MLIGSNAIGDQQDYVVPGAANAFQVTAKATSTLNSLAIYLDPTSTATSVVLGVYSDHGNKPGTLLTQATITSPVNGAWNRVTAPAVTITAGSAYWLVILGPSGHGTNLESDKQTHRALALTSIGIATGSYLLMLFGNK